MAVHDLIAALHVADPDRKRAIISQLGDLGDVNAIPALSAMVRDSRESIRHRRLAATALGRIGDSRGCMALLVVLDAPAQPDRRILPRLESLRDNLQAQLSQANSNNRQHLQEQLIEIEDTIAHDGDMVRLLKISTVQALGDIGYVLALKPLDTMVSVHPDARLVAVAEIALRKIRERSGLLTAEELPEEEPEPAPVITEFLVCSRCDNTSETAQVMRCQNCRIPICQNHSIAEVGLWFCSQTCLDSFANKPGNWEYWV